MLHGSKTYKIPVFSVLNTLDVTGYKTINKINKEMTLQVRKWEILNKTKQRQRGRNGSSSWTLSTTIKGKASTSFLDSLNV